MDIVSSINRFLAGSEPSKGVRTRLVKARDEFVRLRALIEAEGLRNDTCTKDVLGACEECRCGTLKKGWGKMNDKEFLLWVHDDNCSN